MAPPARPPGVMCSPLALASSCSVTPAAPFPARLLACFRRLVDGRGAPVGPQRVWLSTSWVPGLAMSRALGDAVAHSVGVSSGACVCACVPVPVPAPCQCPVLCMRPSVWPAGMLPVSRQIVASLDG